MRALGCESQEACFTQPRQLFSPASLVAVAAANQICRGDFYQACHAARIRCKRSVLRVRPSASVLNGNGNVETVNDAVVVRPSSLPRLTFLADRCLRLCRSRYRVTFNQLGTQSDSLPVKLG